MTRKFWLCLGIPALVVGCQNKPKQEMTTTTTGATLPAAARADRLTNCPSAVAGSITVVAAVPDGIELRVTGNEQAMAEIRHRTEFLTRASASSKGKHDGAGTGGAQFGRCPVVMRNTSVQGRDIPGGAIITVKPSDPIELDWLQREVEQRSAGLANPKAFGQGNLARCPSSVPNAETTVIDAPYGADVKVMAPNEDAARMIRTRAHDLSQNVKSAGPAERCPVAMDNTILVFSDIPGGAMIAIKTNKPEDVASVRHTARERAAEFEAPVLQRDGGSPLGR
ncbi:MAG: hypothetical protein ABIP89_12135 [Polyangiaceae bacterium]